MHIYFKIKWDISLGSCRRNNEISTWWLSYNYQRRWKNITVCCILQFRHQSDKLCSNEAGGKTSAWVLYKNGQEDDWVLHRLGSKGRCQPVSVLSERYFITRHLMIFLSSFYLIIVIILKKLIKIISILPWLFIFYFELFHHTVFI